LSNELRELGFPQKGGAMNEKLVEGIEKIMEDNALCYEEEGYMLINRRNFLKVATAIAERLVVDEDKLFCLLNSLQEYRDEYYSKKTIDRSRYLSMLGKEDLAKAIAIAEDKPIKVKEGV